MPDRLVLRKPGTLGRGDNAEYYVTDKSVSRSHCDLQPLAEAVRITDRQSHNGTFVNGQRISEAIMVPGDVLRTGDLTFRFGIEGGLCILTGCVEADIDSLARQYKNAATPGREDSIILKEELGRICDLLGSQAVFLVEASGRRRSVCEECVRGDFVLSATALQICQRLNRPIWAPRDLRKAAASLQGCHETSAYCVPLAGATDGRLLFYGFWVRGPAFRLEVVERLLAHAGPLLAKRSTGRRSAVASAVPDFAIGRSRPFEELCRQARRIAATAHPVVVLGPRGAGKSTIARVIHSLGPRSEKVLVRLDCADLADRTPEAATRSCWEQAAGGTLLVASPQASLEVQESITARLRGVSEQAVASPTRRSTDVRCVVTMTGDPAELMRNGRLKPLFWDLVSVQQLVVPPLTARPGDIPELALDFLSHEHPVRVKGFTEDGVKALQEYSWPGNVRELSNVIKRLTILGSGPIANAQDVRKALYPSGTESPSATRSTCGAPLSVQVDEFERARIEEAIEKAEGNKSKAARLLRISRKALYDKLRRLGLLRPERKS